ncbi:hypothetical protein [Halalkalibacter urbisdiaboli]|uniref:hypothetical protein n=1 Tax=Halalkalibacter urbisdiaboli TaxID=1960589 RepID=UPI000B454AE3|nr:hypothetical protein [Halalkalibacter urbisdiaboli]
MKLLTYKNPFELQGHDHWDDIKKFPHLCVSQTLVEGLKAYYGREQFSLICTIDSFLKQFYSEWHGNNEQKLLQYIYLSKEIKKLGNDQIRSSFTHNRNDILESIRFIIECGITPEDFRSVQHLTIEQNYLVGIYEKLINFDCFQRLFHQSERGMEGLQFCTYEILLTELERDLHLKEADNNQDRIQNITKEFSNLKEDKKNKNVLEHILNLLSKELPFDKVVIHGVHQFTPLIHKFVTKLESMGVEVIFLFNYCQEFQTIYSTWGEVYSWTKKDIVSSGSLFEVKARALGENIGSTFEGNVRNVKKTGESLLKFTNLTAFTDYVSPIYTKAKKSAEEAAKNNKIKKIEIIKNMKEQFYAVDGSEMNELLKVYFPEHFGGRHFLSYPIGQFILGIYNMWNPDKKELELDANNLKECLALNIWKFNQGLTPLQMYYDLGLYFKGANTLKEYKSRLEIVKKTVSGKERNRTRKLSFFRYTESDIDDFISVIEYIDNFASQLFKEGQVDLKEHYQGLIEYLSENMNKKEISAKEVAFIDDIKKRLDLINIENVVADIEDIKETLHFYLAAQENKDQEAEWIVRDFEQIDGGVLLAKAREEKKRLGIIPAYHFAGLSDENLLNKTKKSLPFPITIDMIEGINDVASIVATSKKEYIHFLRFSLFYGTYFLSPINSIKLSYIEELDEDQAQPYSILRILGIPSESFEEHNEFENTEPMLPYNENSTVSIDPNMDASMKRSGQACYLKFLFNHCLDEFTYYNDEFSLQYVSKLLATYTSITRYREKGTSIDSTLKQFKKLFPFMDVLDHRQIEKMVEGNITSDLQENYIDTKLEFKYASWKDSQMNVLSHILKAANLSDFEYNRFIKDLDRFINDDDFPFLPKKHHWKICDICNQKYVCTHGLKVKEN